MLFDAIVVAGGRSSRLGGSPKASLVVAGETLLSRAIAAASGARKVVVVGPVEATADSMPLPDLDDRVLTTREEPPFGGPVAALAAGIEALDELDVAASEYILLLACDMPNSAAGVTAVLDAADSGRARQVAGFVAVDEERHPQPLLAVYDRVRLIDALDQLGPDVANASMRAVLDRVDLVAVEVPPGSADDIDTWADAARYGIEHDEETT